MKMTQEQLKDDHEAEESDRRDLLTSARTRPRPKRERKAVLLLGHAARFLAPAHARLRDEGFTANRREARREKNAAGEANPIPHPHPSRD